MLILFPSRTCIDLQSKECQKLHWRSSHKTVCTSNAAIIRGIAESPEGKGWTKKVERWIKAWSPSISYCLPLALDLANHEWGRHDTHAYVPSALGFKFVLSDPIPMRSLVMFMDPTDMGEGYQSFRVWKFRTHLNPSA